MKVLGCHTWLLQSHVLIWEKHKENKPIEPQNSVTLIKKKIKEFIEKYREKKSIIFSMSPSLTFI